MQNIKNKLNSFSKPLISMLKRSSFLTENLYKNVYKND